MCDIPTLIMHGEDDIFVGKELHVPTMQYVSNLKLVYVPNCSHWIQMDAVEEVNRNIDDFLNE